MSNLKFLRTVSIPDLQLNDDVFIDNHLYVPGHANLSIEVITSASGRVGWIYQEWDDNLLTTGNWRRLYKGSQLYELKRMKSSSRLGFKLYRGLTDVEIKIWKDE